VACCPLERRDQLPAVLGASPRRRDDDLDAGGPELPGPANLLARCIRRAFDLLGRQAAVAFDVFPETRTAPFQPDRNEATAGIGFGDEQPQSVRANVDDGDPHPRHSARRVGGRPERPGNPAD
jgi:hypothetical protein